MSFSPTTEQDAIVSAFQTGDNLVIEAGAGTGKTSTLRLMAEATDRKGIYVAYNRAIADDAKAEFPANVQCRTAHSLAYGAIVSRNRAIQRRLKGPRVPSKQAVAALGIAPGGLRINDEQTLPAWTLARLAMDTVNSYCNSADDEINQYHVPKIEGIEDHDFLANYIVPFACKAWADLTSDDGKLKFQHDHYLKMWALTNPNLRCDFILFDEAQDANPVIAKVVANQNCQQVMVGDRSQAIYGWRGAVDTMSKFEAPHHLVLSQSFRFGPAIAEQANKWLAILDAPLRLSGFEKINSVVSTLTDPDAILCRTNAEVIAQAMGAQREGKRVAIVGGTGEIKRFAEGARDLMGGRKSSHPDLMAFNTWSDVQEYANADEGRDLKVMVKLLDSYGVAAILSVCETSCNEDSADLIVSTAHKAKGREWNRVRLADDFRAPEEGTLPSKSETMLLYVSITRAKITLDCSSVSWIDLLGVA
jgi:hypothetical protein